MFKLFATIGIKDDGAAATIAKIGKSFADLGSKADSSVRAAADSTTKFGDSLAGVGQKAEGNVRSVNEVKAAVLKLAATYQKEGMSKSDAMKRAHSEMAGEMDAAKKAAQNLGSGVGGLAGALGEAAAKAGKFASSVADGFAKAGKGLAKVGAGFAKFDSVATQAMGVAVDATLAAGASLYGLGVTATKTGMTFEGEMSK